MFSGFEFHFSRPRWFEEGSLSLNFNFAAVWDEPVKALVEVPDFFDDGDGDNDALSLAFTFQASPARLQP